MIETLRAPLKLSHQLLAALGALLAVTFYCLAYNRLQGISESPAVAASWALANILPWLAAFEAGKRQQQIGAKALILAVALAASLGIGLLLGEAGAPGFELVRRVPALLITAGLLTALHLSRGQNPASATRQAADLPLAPEQIDWIAAAGNYVELHWHGRTLIHRAPLSAVEAQLLRHGFVRVHRSILVQRDRIQCVRPLDILLDDGTSLKSGKRYRASL
jgi:hypothetical protein